MIQINTLASRRHAYVLAYPARALHACIEPLFLIRSPKYYAPQLNTISESRRNLPILTLKCNSSCQQLQKKKTRIFRKISEVCFLIAQPYNLFVLDVRIV
jgi:hypothetical protein